MAPSQWIYSFTEAASFQQNAARLILSSNSRHDSFEFFRVHHFELTSLNSSPDFSKFRPISEYDLDPERLPDQFQTIGL